MAKDTATKCQLQASMQMMPVKCDSSHERSHQTANTDPLKVNYSFVKDVTAFGGRRADDNSKRSAPDVFEAMVWHRTLSNVPDPIYEAPRI